MDNFKLNAAKIIAAQKEKNRPQSPESISNWDSTDPEDNNDSGPRLDELLSSEDESPRTDRKPAKKNALKEDRTTASNKSSPRSLNAKTGANAYTDRSSHLNDQEIAPMSLSPKPPYDFRGAFKDDYSAAPPVTDQRTGASRKNNKYDPEPVTNTELDLGSWNDSDAEERTLAALREGMRRNSAPLKATVENQNEVASGDRKEKSDKGGHFRKKKNKNDSQQLITPEKAKKERKGFGFGAPPSKRAGDPDRSPGGGGGQDGKERRYSQISASTHGEQQHIIYFEHGDVNYYDSANNKAYMVEIADSAESWIKRGYQELFAILRIMVGLVVIFLTELLKFLGDSILKPIFAALFNSLVQPVSIFAYNVLLAVKNVLAPLLELLKGLASVIANILRAFRLVDYHYHHGPMRANEKEYLDV